MCCLKCLWQLGQQGNELDVYYIFLNFFFHIKVQTRTWTCGRGVTCNCGAVLRDHNDVIEFNCCNALLRQDSTTKLKKHVRSKKSLSPGISIYEMQSGVQTIKYQVGLTMTVVIIIIII